MTMPEVLSPDELVELTRYKMAKFQMRELERIGIRATLMRDNTVLVLRAHLINPGMVVANQAPQRTSAKK